MAIGQTVLDRGPVEEGDILELEIGLARVEVDLDVIQRNYTRAGQPEKAVRKRVNAGIVGMDRAPRAREDVESDECEGALVVFAVDADVFPPHEPIIEGQGQGVAVRIGPRAGARGNTNE